MNRKWVGVDTHKNTLACYKNGKFKEFSSSQKGFKSAIDWAGKESLWAVEGAYCFGRPLANFLINNGCQVYEINPMLTRTWRKIYSINGKKNDYGDAKVISLYAHTANLPQVSFQTIKLKEKLTARALLVKQRTKTINFIKMSFATRGEDIPTKDLTTIKAGKWLSNHNDYIIRNFGEILKKLTQSIKEIEKDIEDNLPEKAQRLLPLKGIGVLTAASIYAETKGKLTSREAFANYAGISPVENSSGKTNKHRNNKGGNRRLNCIFYRISLHQSRFDEEGKKYYNKKLGEGKSKKLARKCLARQLVRIVFNLLKD